MPEAPELCGFLTQHDEEVSDWGQEYTHTHADIYVGVCVCVCVCVCY